jgi:hypothetical protein
MLDRCETGATEMSASTAAGRAVASITPLRDPSRSRRLVKIVGWVVGITILLILLELIGVDVKGWLRELWEQVDTVPTWALVGGTVLQIAQTTFNGLAYYGILSYGYPDAGVTIWPIVTAYAVGVASWVGSATSPCWR